jgi:hypothetical protein
MARQLRRVDKGLLPQQKLSILQKLSSGLCFHLQSSRTFA